jgi:hypothetical protein
MKTSSKSRRSKRVPANHRLLITVLGPSGAEISKEIVSTVEVSQHGARVRGRRTLRPEAQGTLTQLSSGRQVPFRVAWQQKGSEPNSLDTGVELLSNFDFWGAMFAEPSAEPEPAPVPAPALVEGNAVPLSPAELLDELRKAAQSPSDHKTRVLEAVWCALIDQLEERRVITRDELLTAIRSVAVPTREILRPASKA